MASSECLVREVVKLGMPVRINNVKEFLFDPRIDGAPSLYPQRVLSVPLKDQITDRVVGVMHIINKTSNDVFTAADDILYKVRPV